MVVFISVVEAAMEIILQVVAAEKIGCSSTRLVSGSLYQWMVINPLIGVYIAIISYPVIKGGVSLTPQYNELIDPTAHLLRIPRSYVSRSINGGCFNFPN